MNEAGGSRIQPIVSVVIPCYEGERFLGDAVESVLSQTLADLELIVVDDGSKDGSALVVERYMGDPRVKMIRHSVNLGIPAARNSGIRLAAGRYVAFLDQDDVWKKDKLEKQLRVLESRREEGFGAVFSAVEFRDPAGRRLRAKKKRIPRGFNELPKEEMLEALFMDNFVPMVSALVAKECFGVVGTLDETIRSGADDYEFFLRLLEHYRVYYVPEVLVTRRLHGSNYTDPRCMAPETMEILSRFAGDRPRLARLQRGRKAVLMADLAAYYMRMGEMEEAKRYFKRALELSPYNLRARIGYANACSGRAGRILSRLWYRMRAS